MSATCLGPSLANTLTRSQLCVSYNSGIKSNKRVQTRVRRRTCYYKNGYNNFLQFWTLCPGVQCCIELVNTGGGIYLTLDFILNEVWVDCIRPRRSIRYIKIVTVKFKFGILLFHRQANCKKPFKYFKITLFLFYSYTSFPYTRMTAVPTGRWIHLRPEKQNTLNVNDPYISRMLSVRMPLMYCPQVVLGFSIMLSGSKFLRDIFFVRAEVVRLNYYCVCFVLFFVQGLGVFSDVIKLRYTIYTKDNTKEVKTL